jgi:hypothetical protein
MKHVFVQKGFLLDHEVKACGEKGCGMWHLLEREYYRLKHKLATDYFKAASELYRPSDRRISKKLVPAFKDSECRTVSATNSYSSILGFLNRSCYFFFHVAPQL